MHSIMPIYLVLFLAVNVWCYFLILRKTGRSAWWCLIIFVPLVNIIMIWAFAFVRWPRIDGQEEEMSKDWNSPSWRAARTLKGKKQDDTPPSRTSVPRAGDSPADEE